MVSGNRLTSKDFRYEHTLPDSPKNQFSRRVLTAKLFGNRAPIHKVIIA